MPPDRYVGRNLDSDAVNEATIDLAVLRRLVDVLTPAPRPVLTGDLDLHRRPARNMDGDLSRPCLSGHDRWWQQAAPRSLIGGDEGRSNLFLGVRRDIHRREHSPHGRRGDVETSPVRAVIPGRDTVDVSEHREFGGALGLWCAHGGSCSPGLLRIRAGQPVPGRPGPRIGVVPPYCATQSPPPTGLGAREATRCDGAAVHASE